MAQWTTAPVSKTGIIGGSNPSAPAMNISDSVKESYPHLWHLVSDEHDPTGEIELALAELTELKMEINRHHQDFDRWEKIADRATARWQETRKWEIVFVVYTDWLLKFYEKFTANPTSSDLSTELNEFIRNVVEVNKKIYGKAHQV